MDVSATEARHESALHPVDKSSVVIAPQAVLNVTNRI